MTIKIIIEFLWDPYHDESIFTLILKIPVTHIVNISSMGGFLPEPGQTIYGVSKAAVKLLTEGLHAELLDTNVEVFAVFSGAIEINITANSGIDQRALMNNNTRKKKIHKAFGSEGCCRNHY